MIAHAFKRILSSIPTLFALVTLTFFLMKAVPGGPFDGERALGAEVRASLDAKYHLNEPVLAQYVQYVKDLSHGQFGTSLRSQGSRSVGDIVSDALPVSAVLGIGALGVSLVLGLLLGVFSAAEKNTWFDSGVLLFVTAGLALPNFLVAAALILVFSLTLKWLPPALWDDWTSAILPIFTLSVRPTALIARMVRTTMLEVFQTDYFRTARAKGLGPGKVLFKHALKNSLLPVVTLLGPIAASLIAGSFIVETVFAVPGLGKYFVNAVIDRDYPLIMASTLVFGLIMIAMNLIVDLLYAWLDPRIKL